MKQHTLLTHLPNLPIPINYTFLLLTFPPNTIYWLNSSNSCRSIQIVCSCVSFGRLCISRTCCISSSLSNLDIELFIIVLSCSFSVHAISIDGLCFISYASKFCLHFFPLASKRSKLIKSFDVSG